MTKTPPYTCPDIDFVRNVLNKLRDHKDVNEAIEKLESLRVTNVQLRKWGIELKEQLKNKEK